jgi:tetratricopeptide (TPR) repeat protein
MEADVDKKPEENEEGHSSPQGGSKEKNEQQSSPQGHAPGRASRRPAPHVVDTEDPAIETGPVSPSSWIGEPDEIMFIETSRIRQAPQPLGPNMILVPVESETPRDDKKGQNSDNDPSKRNGEQDGKNGGGKQSERKSSRDKPDGAHAERENQQGQNQERPLWKTLLYSAGISLLCSVIVAGAMVYFFSGSSVQGSAGKGSGSSKSSSKGKGGGSKSEGPKSGQGADSGEESGSGESSDTSKNSEPGQSPKKKGESTKLLEAETAWLTAMNELREAKESEKMARRSEQETRAVLDFFKNTLLAAGRPGSVSLPDAFWAAGQGKDVTLRKAVDTSAAHVAEAFASTPLAEASTRELLGLAYLSLGDSAQAVKQYERAFALRQAMQGPNDPQTASCRNQLAVAFRLAGHTAQGSRLFEQNPNSPDRARTLSVDAAMLLAQKKPAEAELKLRECLAIRQKTDPDDWTIFDTQSMLGEALLEQRKFAEAEPLLLASYDGLKEREDSIPTEDKPRITKALERLAKLYERWGREEVAAKWRNELRSQGQKTR